MFSFLKSCQTCFSKWLYHFIFPPVAFKCYSCSTSWTTPDMVHLFNFSHSEEFRIISYCGFVFHFLIMTNDVEYLFMYLLAICISTLVKCLFISLPTFNWLFVLLLSCKSSFFFFFFILAVLGLRFCARSCSSCGERGATLHRGVRASHYRGLSYCRAQAPDAQAQ